MIYRKIKFSIYINQICIEIAFFKSNKIHTRLCEYFWNLNGGPSGARDSTPRVSLIRRRPALSSFRILSVAFWILPSVEPIRFSPQSIQNRKIKNPLFGKGFYSKIYFCLRLISSIIVDPMVSRLIQTVAAVTLIGTVKSAVVVVANCATGRYLR